MGTLKHVSEEDLILHYYKEGSGSRAVEIHLQHCSACLAAYDQLRETLDGIDLGPVPERGDGYGRDVWARVGPAILKQPVSPWIWWSGWRRLAWAGTLAAALVVAFLAGRLWPRPVPVETERSAEVQERILLVALGEHFERSQMVLLEILNARTDGSADISAEREQARDLVSSNRLYRRAALSADDRLAARVLEDLEPLLLEIAHSPATMSPAELDQLRSRLQANDVLFRVRVLEGRIQDQQRPVRRIASSSSL